MKPRIITVIPVYNGSEFILQALESVARQTLRPDRLIVLDDCSTDDSEQVVKSFTLMPFEWVRNEKNLGLFGNSNQALGYAEETDYLHMLHQDDAIQPQFYETLTRSLEPCDGYGMAFCLDERIDGKNQRLSVSGRVDGRTVEKRLDEFLCRKAEISNQAWSATLLKTHYQKAPCQFRLDMPILGDMVFWADWGVNCKKIFEVRLPLAQYRWHGTNATTRFAPSIQSLILDEWRTMEMNEALRGKGMGLERKLKLKGLLSVRSNIKAKRFRQNGNTEYSNEIVRAAKAITGTPLWLAGRLLVEIRDLVIYKIQRRPRNPKNVYS